MRIIIDTSVFVRACLQSDVSQHVIYCSLLPGHKLFISDPLLAEYDVIPLQPQLEGRMDVDDYIRVRNAMVEAAHFRRPAQIPPTCRDPSDDHVLALARAVGADLIVTTDKDLLALAAFETARILRPDQAARLLGDPHQDA